MTVQRPGLPARYVGLHARVLFISKLGNTIQDYLQQIKSNDYLRRVYRVHTLYLRKERDQHRIINRSFESVMALALTILIVPWTTGSRPCDRLSSAILQQQRDEPFLLQ